jgi:hypothetical protein
MQPELKDISHQKYLAKTNVMASNHLPYSPDLLTLDFFTHKCREVIAKATRALKGNEKWFPGMLPKALRTLGNMSLPKRTILKEMLCKQI